MIADAATDPSPPDSRAHPFTRDARLRKEERLLRPRQFRLVFDSGASKSDRTLVVYGLRNDLGYARLGVVVSRKHGKAHARSRIKRLFREAFRNSKQELPVADLVVLPRRGTAGTLTLDRVRQSLTALANKIKLPSPPPPQPSDDDDDDDAADSATTPATDA